MALKTCDTGLSGGPPRYRHGVLVQAVAAVAIWLLIAVVLRWLG